MEIGRIEYSNDNTIKVIFVCDDNSEVEACLLSLKKHGTVICISSQVGCMQNCTFCASGLSPFKRNLTVDEIVNQAELIINRFPEFFKTKFQITYMGSGEPFLNQNNLISSMEYFYKNLKNLGKINISTILPSLNLFNTQDIFTYKNKLHIQFSLHFIKDSLREKYFGNKLPKIKESLLYLNELSQYIEDKYAINYVLFDKINDSEEDANRLIELVKNTSGYLKISEMCPINKSKLSKSNNNKLFLEKIRLSNIEYDLFESLGTDVNAGCGQFYNESIL